MIEGVMMRAPGCMSVAVRRPNGSIVVTESPMRSKVARSKLWKWPLMRGVAMLVESVGLGYRALHFSAEQQLTEEERVAFETSAAAVRELNEMIPAAVV